MDYYTRFGTSIKAYRSELQSMSNLPKKKRMKQQRLIKGTQINIQHMEEHEYLLEQLLKNKDLIDVDKIDNICEDMDGFLMHPGNKLLRDE